MKVLALVPRGELPSTRLRIVEPFALWEKEGVACRVEPLPPAPPARWAALRRASGWDVVVLQKKTSLPAFELAILRRSNPRLVYDVDDAVMFQEVGDGRPLHGRHFGRFLRTVGAARAVVAGNRFLARFAEAAGRPAAVLPTPVDVERYAPRQKKSGDRDGPVIGWIGLSHNQKYVEPLLPAVGRLRREIPGVRLRIVSDRLLLGPAEYIEWKPWSRDGEPGDVAGFDVGIMPLADNLWTWGKCGYKILQYMASGVPVVASPVGLNTDIVRDGENGFLAVTGEDWLAKLKRLLSSPGLAEEMGARGRSDAERRYSLKSYAGAYLDVVRSVARDEAPRGPDLEGSA